MPEVATVHQDGSAYRRIDQGAVTYEFEIVGDEADVEDGNEYQGDGEIPDDAFDSLREWIDEYHDEVQDSRDSNKSAEQEDVATGRKPTTGLKLNITTGDVQLQTQLQRAENPRRD